MTKNEILQILKDVIGTISDEEICDENMDLTEDLGLSSIDVMSILTACEKKFGVKISAKELRFIETVADLSECIAGKL